MTAFYYPVCSATAPISATQPTAAICPTCGCSYGNHIIVAESTQYTLPDFKEEAEKAKKRRPRPPKNYEERRQWWNKR